MEKAKVFISHSHKDKLVADAVVDLLIKLGLNSKNIIATSTVKAQLHTGTSLYAELKEALSNEKVFVIFLLSDNFYSSTVCMNEMGAAWVNNAKSCFMVLPGFSFERVEGVILENSPIGISLSSFDEIAKTRIKEMCVDITSCYGFEMNEDTMELGLINFSLAIDEYKKQLAGKVTFSMEKAKGFCIGDTDNDGCRIYKRESSNTKTSVILDFTQTTTKLCSVVYRIEQKNWQTFRENGKVLCFEIYSDSETFQAEIELQFLNHSERIPFLINNDIQTCRIPLSQFDASKDDWKLVKECCFLFRKKHVDHRTTVVMENLRLEG